jgi:hypothetical protein
MAEDPGFPQRVRRIEALATALDGIADPATRTSARELMQAVLELHGAGLARLLQLVAEAGPPGRSLLDRFREDSLVASLLLLHGLHPLDVETRVRQALNRVGPHLASHGVAVELLGVAGQVVRLRFDGPWPALRGVLEEAILEAAPDVAALEVVERGEPGAGRVSLPIIQPIPWESKAAP